MKQDCQKQREKRNKERKEKEEKDRMKILLKGRDEEEDQEIFLAKLRINLEKNWIKF